MRTCAWCESAGPQLETMEARGRKFVLCRPCVVKICADWLLVRSILKRRLKWRASIPDPEAAFDTELPAEGLESPDRDICPACGGSGRLSASASGDGR